MKRALLLFLTACLLLLPACSRTNASIFDLPTGDSIKISSEKYSIAGEGIAVHLFDDNDTLVASISFDNAEMLDTYKQKAEYANRKVRKADNLKPGAYRYKDTSGFHVIFPVSSRTMAEIVSEQKPKEIMPNFTLEVE